MIKAIKDNFDIDLFFQTKVQNYKLLASIYKIFEYKDLDNPIELTKSKITIIENITEKPNTVNINETVNISNEPKEIRLLSQKLMVEKFNKKYSEFNDSQKVLLREYIGNVSNTNNIFNKNMHKVKDKSLKIKLKEIINLIETYEQIKNVEENHVSALLRYYSLIEDLSWSK